MHATQNTNPTRRPARLEKAHGLPLKIPHSAGHVDAIARGVAGREVFKQGLMEELHIATPLCQQAVGSQRTAHERLPTCVRDARGAPPNGQRLSEDSHRDVQTIAQTVGDLGGQLVQTVEYAVRASGGAGPISGEFVTFGLE